MRHLIFRSLVDRTLRSESIWPWSEPTLRAHLVACDRCRAYYDDGVRLLRAVRTTEGAPGSGELERMIRRAEGAAIESPARRPAGKLARWAVPVAAMVAVGFWLARPEPVDIGEVVSAGRLVIAGEDQHPGARIFEGQDLVASGGNAVVRLDGGRLVLIKDGSRLRFDQGGAHAIIESGAGYFRVQKGVGRFEVTAGNATVTVKGTEFLVERRDLTSTNVAMDEGRVEVRTGSGRLEVNAGQETLVSGDSIASVRSIDFFERLKRGFQRAGKDLDRMFGGP